MLIINLLPWREIKKRQHRRRFIGLMCGALCVVGTIHGVGLHYFNDLLFVQNKRNSELAHTVISLNSEFEKLSESVVIKNELQQRLSELFEIQQQKNRTTHLFNLLNEFIPNTVFIKRIKLVEWQVSLSGHSKTTSQFTHLLASLEQSPWIKNIKVHSIKTEWFNDHSRQLFSLSLTLLPNVKNEYVE